ncbi:septum formation protein Maf [Bacteroidetes/Chlorobi group bacterium ChocPot_Mid]|nr:MAG: septum formation protein Maf [Bacteroidetes/Chlorobi group bacterium ChocPot_Mid]
MKLKKPLVLASKSPRRRKLLSSLGFEFDVVESNYKEVKSSGYFDFRDYVINSAFNKADEVAKRMKKDCIVIGADTIVVLDNEILHKPVDRQDAFQILKKLSNRSHTVFTGVVLIDNETEKSLGNVQATEVRFRELQDEEIWAYIESGSPMDKAGAYGIQDDFGAVFVSHINGCYYNIVGLPLEMFYTMLKKFV